MELKVGHEGLKRYHSYLDLLGHLLLDPRLRAKIDACGVVRQTLVQARRGLDQVQGRSEAELCAWLRRIFVRHLAHAVKAITSTGRNGPAVTVEASSERLEAWLAGGPSEGLDRNEDLFQLTKGLAVLPEAQREVVLLHYWQEWTVADIARHIGRTPAAVAGLLKRGIHQLRHGMKSND